MTCRLRAVASCSLLHCGQIMQSHSYAVEDRLFLGHAGGSVSTSVIITARAGLQSEVGLSRSSYPESQ